MSGKLFKVDVEFESPAKGKDKCVDCEFFLFDKKECKIVAGRVWWSDWCNRFEAKNQP